MENQDIDITVIKPASPALQRLIKYFYFCKSNNPDLRRSYLTFPQVTTPLSLFKNTRLGVSADGHNVTCLYDAHSPSASVIVGIFTQPLLVTYRGQVDEVSVVFEPLGLNHFTSNSYSEVAGRIGQPFNPYGPEFGPFVNELFSLPAAEDRRDAIEYFFLKHYTCFEDRTLSQAVVLLNDSEENLSIAEIADTVGLSYKSFTRLAMRHLGATPVTLRKVMRFRRSLKRLATTVERGHFTQAAHDLNFYDQSHFIKDYYQLAGESPRQFFRNVSRIGDEDIYWRFL